MFSEQFKTYIENIFPVKLAGIKHYKQKREAAQKALAVTMIAFFSGDSSPDLSHVIKQVFEILLESEVFDEKELRDWIDKLYEPNLRALAIAEEEKKALSKTKITVDEYLAHRKISSMHKEITVFFKLLSKYSHLDDPIWAEITEYLIFVTDFYSYKKDLQHGDNYNLLLCSDAPDIQLGIPLVIAKLKNKRKAISKQLVYCKPHTKKLAEAMIVATENWCKTTPRYN